MSKRTLKSILNVTGSQCKDLRTGVICSDFQIFRFSSQNPGIQLSNGLLWKAGEETITIIHPVEDKGMDKFILTGNITSNSCNVFETIVC